VKPAENLLRNVKFMTKKISFFRILLSAAILLLSFNAHSYAVKPGAKIGKKITFITNDGVIISALYYPPASKSMKTFILLHGLASNQEEWQPFAHNLARLGYGFLSYDARGHGESTRDIKGKKISYANFSPPGPASEWERMVSDLEKAVKTLETTYGTPAKKIALAGASLGANVCLIYGSMDKSIPAVVLLSPGLNYAGFAASGPVLEYSKRAVLIAASPGDTYAYQSSSLLYAKIKSNKRSEMLSAAGGRHGVQMFEDKVFTNKLLSWISRN